MDYKTGFDFFRDLVSNYGKEEAVKIGNSYLDLPDRTKDPEEFKFCCELYKAIQAIK